MAPRIELEYDFVADELTGASLEIQRELLRRAIFIDLGAGTSRHQGKATMRWHLRRIYLPGFGAALFKNDAIKHDYDWLKYFLTEPEDVCRDEFNQRWRRPTRSTSKRPRQGQQKLPWK